MLFFDVCVSSVLVLSEVDQLLAEGERQWLHFADLIHLANLVSDSDCITPGTVLIVQWEEEGKECREYQADSCRPLRVGEGYLPLAIDV